MQRDSQIEDKTTFLARLTHAQKMLSKLQSSSYSMNDVISISGLTQALIMLIIKEEGIKPLWFHDLAYFIEMDVETIVKYVNHE